MGLLVSRFDAPAQDYAVESVAHTGAVITVSVESDTNSYYILKGAPAVGGASTAVDIDLGYPLTTLLSDFPPPPAPHFFYHVARNPLIAPLDTDEDGIHDVFELNLSTILDALDPADALEDADLDTVNNLREFQRGTDLTNALSVNTSLYANVDTGNDTFDGLAPAAANGHGPKQTVQSAIDRSISGDDIHVAGGGSPYLESVWDPAGMDLTLIPNGHVVVMP